MSLPNGAETRRMRVSIIGAGISGLLMAYKLRENLGDHVQFDIYEKSPDLGGTWYENKYPGCACDVPSHVYQFSFAPNPAWSTFYASSEEIQTYLKNIAQSFNLQQSIHFNSKVVLATWSETKCCWTIELEDGSRVESELLVNAGGILNNPHVPNIQGLADFRGPVLHTAAWDRSVSLKGKRVAVIGAGASAIQLLPQIQPIANHVDVFIRTPSWITPPVGLSESGKRNHTYSEDEKNDFATDATKYLATRKEMETYFNGMFRAFFKDSIEQKDLRHRLQSRMKELVKDEELQRKLIPSFEVGCRRINPGEAYLETLQEKNVAPVFQDVRKITENAVVTGDGAEHTAEIIILATGFDTSFRPRFSILGSNGVNMQDLWSEQPTSYMGIGISGFPNYLVFLGPNTPISNGSLIGVLEATGDFFIRLIRKMIRQKVASFDVRPEAQADFDTHTQCFMKDMVWTGTCRSWFKQGPGGKVTALWPGSSLHYMQTLAEDRWEDYDWRYSEERYSYWNSGISWVEDPSADILGLEARESYDTMSTIPHKGADLSYYLRNSGPILSITPEPPTEDVITLPAFSGEDIPSIAAIAPPIAAIV